MSDFRITIGNFDKIADYLDIPPSITRWQRLESDLVELYLASGLEAWPQIRFG